MPRKFLLPDVVALFAIVSIGLNLVPSTFAASHTWSGAVSGNWNVVGNWSAGGVPTLAETNSLSFPAGAARTVTTNNIGALNVSAFTFSGSNYIVRGANTFTIQPSLINILCSGASNTIESPLTFASTIAVTVAEGDEIFLSGALSGAGGLIKFGTGRLYLRGGAANSFSGGVTVSIGAVHLEKTGGATAVSGPVTIIGTTNFGETASVRLFSSEQISANANVIIHPTGVLNLGGFTNTINNLTVMAGSVFPDGLLRISGSMTLSATDNVFPAPDVSPLITGSLEFLGTSNTITVSNLTCEIEANIVEYGTTNTLFKDGPGTLWLQGGGNNPGNIIVKAGTLRAEQVASLGTAIGSTTVSNGASLILGSAMTTSESLNLAGNGVGGQGALQIAGGLVTSFGNITVTDTTSGRVPLVGDQLFLNGIISGTGGLRKLGEGELRLLGANTNTFTGASFVDKGLLTLSKNANVRAIASVTVTNGAQLVFSANEQIDNAGVLSIHPGGSVNLTNRTESIGGLNLGSDAVLDMGLGTLTTFGTIYAGPPYTTNSNGKATIRGNLSLGGGQRTFSTDSTRLYLDCHISDGAGVGGIFQEWDGGAIHLMRSNSFTGPVSLSGFCYLSNAFAFGAPGGGLFSTNSTIGIIVFEHPTIAIGGENVTSWERGIEFRSDGTNAWNGSIALLSNSVYNATYPPDLSLNGAGELAINGVISGPGTVKISDGTLRLTASNTYSMGHFLGGTLIVQHTNALGVPGLKTYLAGGHRLVLQLPNGGAVTGHTLRPWLPIGGPGGTLEVIGAVSNTWAGPVEMSLFDQFLQVNVPETLATLRIDGTISGTGSLEKTGDGSLYLAGTNPNTFTGETIVTNGTLCLNKPNGVQATGNLTVNHPGKVVWAASEQIANAATLALGLYTFGITNTHADLGNHTETFTHLTITNTGVSLFASSGGTLNLLGDITLASGTMFISPNIVFPVGTHQVAGDFNSYAHFLGSIRETGGSAGLILTNTDVFLAASNSFSGPLVMDRGQLTIQHPAALGTSAGFTTLANYSLLYLDLPADAVVGEETLILTPIADPDLGFEIRMYNHVTNTWTGPIMLQERCRFLVYETSGQLNVTGPITGTEPITSSTIGTLVLGGNTTNSFNGLFARAGTVRLAKPPGVPAIGGDVVIEAFGVPAPVLVLDGSGQLPPGTTVSNGTAGTFNLNGYATTIKRLLGVGQVQIGTGTLTISNAVAELAQFLGTIQGAPGGMNLIKQGIGEQRVGNFALQGAMTVQGGTVLMDNGSIGALDISAGALMDMYAPVANFGSLSGAGSIYTAGNGLINVGGNSAHSTFSGVIFGSSQTNIVKIGTGVLTLTGTNTDTGKTVVQNGTLLVNGSLAGPVHVEPTAPGTIATLGGTGVLQNASIVGLGARLAPGATTNVPSYGKLTAVNVAVVSGAIYDCEIGGTNAGVNLDQIEATDTVTLSGVTPTGGSLNVNSTSGGALSNRFTIVKSTPGVSGIFTGKAEGSTFSPSAGRTMQITYLGGTSGHDIVLTLIEKLLVPPGSTDIQRVPGGIQLNAMGEPNSAYLVQINTNLNTTNWFDLGTIAAGADGSLQFSDGVTNHAMCFYRLKAF